MKKNLSMIEYLVLMVFISACYTQEGVRNKDALFESLVPGCTMNSELSFLPLQGEYEFHEFIDLVSINHSYKSVIFPADSNVRIITFMKESQKWIELTNDVQYVSSPEPFIILHPSNDELNHSSIAVVPVPPENIQVHEIRVVITGYIYQDNIETDECVGAFIDILMTN